MIFADLEMFANAAVLNQLANVRVALGDRLDVPGIFKNPSVVAGVGIGATTTGPTLTVDSGSVMDKPVDQTITVAGMPYVILASDPDGTGLTVLTLGLDTDPAGQNQ